MLQHSFSIRHFCQLHRAKMIGLLLAGVTQQGINLLSVVAVGGFFELMFHHTSSRASWMHSLGLQPTSMPQYLWLFAALLVARWSADILVRWRSAWLEEHWSAQLRQSMFAVQMLHHPSSFERKQQHRYLLRYSHDLKSAQQIITKGWIDLIRQLLVVGSGLAMMWWLFPPFGLAALSLVVLSACLFWLIAHRSNKAQTDSRNKRSNMLHFVSRQFQKFQQIQDKGLAAPTTLRFYRRSAALLQANKRYRWQEAIMQTTAAVLPSSMLLIFFAIAWNWGGLNYANAMMLVLLIMQWQSPLRKLLRIPGIIQKGNLSLQKMTMQLTHPVVPVSKPITKRNIAEVAAAV